jgi:hypothetical protein
MGFDEFFGHGNKHHNRGHEYNHGKYDEYGHNKYRSSSHSHSQHSDIKHMLLNMLRDNPKLKAILIFAVILVAIVVVGVVIMLFPLIYNVLSYITENGVQGIIDAIWKGTK